MSSTQPHLTSGLFRRACGRFATGVVVAAVLDAGRRPHGLTINSFTSVSLDPPLVLICIDYRAAIFPSFREAPYFGLSILSGEQQDISHRFATRPDDRFDGVEWREGRYPVPLITGALATLECRLDRLLDAGDHGIFLGEALQASVNDGEPLVYYQGYRKLQRPQQS